MLAVELGLRYPSKMLDPREVHEHKRRQAPDGEWAPQANGREVARAHP